MRRLFTFILTSGIFSSKDEELDILPPPPPFPKIGAKIEEAKATEKAAREEKRKLIEKEKELKLQKKKEADEEIRIKKENDLQEKERLKAKERQRKERKEKLFKLLHGAGLVKTDKEKEQIRKEKENYRNLKLQEKKKKEELRIKAEQERIKQKDLEKSIKSGDAERLRKEKESAEKEEQKQKLSIQKANEKEKLRLENEEQRQIVLNAKANEKERKTLEKLEKFQKGTRKKKELGLGADLPKLAESNIPEKRPSIKEQFFGLFPKINFGKEEKSPNRDAIITKEADAPILKKIKTKKINRISLQDTKGLWQESKQKTGFKDLFASLSQKKLEPSEEKLEGLGMLDESRIKTEKRLDLKEDLAENTKMIGAEKEIQEAIDNLKATKKKPFLSGIFTKKENVSKSIEGEPRVEMPHIMPRTYDKIDFVEMVEAKIHKARMALMDFKFEDAKRIYTEVMRIYNKMELKDKHDVYEDIKDLYYERKNAEKFANKQ